MCVFDTLCEGRFNYIPNKMCLYWKKKYPITANTATNISNLTKIGILLFFIIYCLLGKYELSCVP